MNRALALARLCEALDTYDVCHCTDSKPPFECPACVLGQAWRAAYLAILERNDLGRDS